MPDNPTGLLGASTGIAALRWQVTLYRRDQIPGPNSAIRENLVKLATVWADIQATYPGTFYASTQVDTPVTHMIRLRWVDYLETIAVIVRTTWRPSDHTNRSEIYRVRRVRETGGRKRFCELECELERVATTEGDSESEIEETFAEHPLL